MSEQTIYNTLINAGLNHIGTLAIMGNMMAESSLKSNIVQRGFTNLSDEEFTLRVDNDALDFLNDFKGGYGLCQWTYRPRKVNLLNYARQCNTSIGDEQMQVNFCIKEFKAEYSPLWNWLCTADNLRDAVERVCVEYERPAVNNIDQRWQFAIEIGQRLEAQGTAVIEAGATDTNVVDYDYLADLEAHAKAILAIIEEIKK